MILIDALQTHVCGDPVTHTIANILTEQNGNYEFSEAPADNLKVVLGIPLPRRQPMLG